MGKISPIANKYIIHASIFVEGVVDRPDVIGAVFGQTEGLLGEELELRELQRSGRIGRIEVNLETNYGKTKGMIIIPSSLDKAETAIVGAALEIIQRIGPCNAKIKVENIEDVRVLKRTYVINRAKELLKKLMETAMPDSQELSEEVATSVRVMEVQTWGKDRLPAGPGIEDYDEIILVEGRADVLNLLKHGFKNVIGMNGSNVPESIIGLCKQKIVTAFLDGDRGGDLNLQELTQVTEIDYVCRAPDGKEVEELAKKEIHKCLRARVATEQALMEYARKQGNNGDLGDHKQRLEAQQKFKRPDQQRPDQRSEQRPAEQHPREIPQKKPMPREEPSRERDNRDRGEREIPQPAKLRPKASNEEKDVFRNMLEDLIGTKGACVLDPNLNVMGKVPLSELNATIKNFSEGVYAIAFDGSIDEEIVRSAESANVKFLVGMDLKVDPKATSKVSLLTINDL